MSEKEKPRDIKERTFSFALEVVKFCRTFEWRVSRVEGQILGFVIRAIGSEICIGRASADKKQAIGKAKQAVGIRQQ